jgi:hypothetical protein
MVRHRFHLVFALGRFNEGVKWVRDLNEACRNAGCVEGRLWALGYGKVNECVLEYDYPDLATNGCRRGEVPSDEGYHDGVPPRC